MTDLYVTPAERAKQLRESTKTGNIFQDIFTDYVSDGISRNEDRSIKREGAAWWLQGFTPGAESIADQKKGLDDARIVDRAVQESGLTPSQIKEEAGGKQLTPSNVGGIIAEGRRTRAEKPTPVQEVQLKEATDARIESNKLTAAQIQAGITNTNATLQAQTQQNNATNQRLLAQGAQSHQLALITAADARDAAAQQLELQRQQMIREDQRYNERQEKLDRKDRREGVSNLVAGLAALGAAFAI